MQPVKKIASNLISNEKTPIVLTIVACTGVVATTVMAIKATPKASRILAQVREEQGVDKLAPLEVLKHTWKLYAPCAGVGCVTIGTILTINRINERNAAILTTGATLATATLREYQQHVLEEIGAEKESKIRDKIARHRIADDPMSQKAEVIILTGNEILCYDELSGRYFKCDDIEKIKTIENHLNKTILSEFAVSLNELYYHLGLEEIRLGDLLGFNMDNMVDFHFSSQLTDNNKPVLVLGYINMPVPKFRDYGAL